METPGSTHPHTHTPLQPVLGSVAKNLSTTSELRAQYTRHFRSFLGFAHVDPEFAVVAAAVAVANEDDGEKAVVVVVGFVIVGDIVVAFDFGADVVMVVAVVAVIVAMIVVIVVVVIKVVVVVGVGVGVGVAVAVAALASFKAFLHR